MATNMSFEQGEGDMNFEQGEGDINSSETEVWTSVYQDQFQNHVLIETLFQPDFSD